MTTPRRTPLRRRPAMGACAVAAVALSGFLGSFAPVALAQTGDEPSTSSTTTSTNPSNSSSTTTTQPSRATLPAPTTTAQPPPEPPPGDPEEDAQPTEVPAEQVVVPAREGPPPQDPLGPYLEALAQARLEMVEKALLQAQEARALVGVQVETLIARIAELDQRLLELETRRRAAVADYQEARTILKRRAVASYMGTPASPVNSILEARDFADLTRRTELLGAVLSADKRRHDTFDRARRAVGAELQGVVDELDAARAGLEVSLALLQGAEDHLFNRQLQADATTASSSLATAGFRFPVAGPHSYTDTFGAPRMFGTAYAHLHEGVDIFAPQGTPLVACERGVLIRVGTDVLGGTKLWLVGASGSRYYYAHLSGYAEGVVEGKVVEAGDVVGFVGNTGNALSTPAHLHFEIHPAGGPAVNPTPLLRLVDDATTEFQSKVSPS